MPKTMLNQLKKSDSKVVHDGIICDKCNNGKSIIGFRYKCQDCKDYDLCDNCYHTLLEESFHPPEHTFTKITSLKVPLPPDCIGEILKFTDDVKIFVNCLLLSKFVKYNIENENYDCAENIKFYIPQADIICKRDGEIKFIHKVEFDVKSKKTCRMLTNKVVLKLVNLKKLVLTNRGNWDNSNSPDLSDKIFQLRLEVLEISGWFRNIADKGVQKLVRLRKLKIDFCRCYGDLKMKMSGRCLMNIPNLEELVLYKVPEEKWDNECFVNLKNLRRLELTRISGITDDVFKYLGKLEHLKLEYCHLFDVDGFNNLKVIKNIVIKNCRGIRAKTFLINAIGADIMNGVKLDFEKYIRRKKGKMKVRF